MHSSQPSPSTIAIIDDDADSRLLARAVLGAPFLVAEYESGEAAAAELPLLRPDLILLDLSLPGADGLSVLQWLRAQPALRAIPVIAFTGHAQFGREERLLAAGFDACVLKPLLSEAPLLEAVERLLAPGRRARRTLPQP